VGGTDSLPCGWPAAKYSHERQAGDVYCEAVGEMAGWLTAGKLAFL
jgi:hypothetical protein